MSEHPQAIAGSPDRGSAVLAALARRGKRFPRSTSSPARSHDGGRARPPEDVGGVGGYANFLEIIADPENPEHRHTRRWAGGHFDPEWFDREMTDNDVRNALRANRRIRLYQRRPKGTRRSRLL
jgi:hypothetical protein